MKYIINIKNLKKEYFINAEYKNLFKRIIGRNKRKILAIDDINLNIEEGKIVAILGENGAGKTTLLKIMCGILTPTFGDVQILGKNPIKDRYNYTYDIGVVFGQRSLLWVDIPVIDSLKLYKNIYEIADEEFFKKIELFDSMLGIKEFLEIPVRKLSLGQRMKCELVAALIHDPKIVFLDEPTIGLDIVSKKKVHEFLKDLNDKFKTTIILTSHDLEDIDELSNEIILMDKGKIVFNNKNNFLKLDTSKKILVKGKINITDDLKKILIESNDEEYIFNYSSKSDLEKIVSNLVTDSEIKIKSTEIKDILLKIYKGELQL